MERIKSFEKTIKCALTSFDFGSGCLESTQTYYYYAIHIIEFELYFSWVSI